MSCPPARRVIGLCQVDETALWPGRLVGANAERLTRPNAVRYVMTPAGQRAQHEIGRPWSRRLVHFTPKCSPSLGRATDDGHDKLPGDGHEAARWRT